jgi:hypothetical protein
VLGALLGMLPVSAALGLRLAAFVTAVAAVWMSAYVLGFTRGELAAAGRWGLRSLVFGYAALLRLLGRGAVGAVRGVSAGGGWIAARRAARAEDALRDREDAVFRAEPPVVAAPRAGLIGRAKSLMARREPEPELMAFDAAPGDTEGRISSRIAEAVRARVGDRPAPVVARAEPPVVRRAPERDHDPVELYDEDDFDLDDYTMPEPELVEGRPALTATPMFETGRSPEAEARRVVQHPPRRRRRSPRRRPAPRRSPRSSTRRRTTRRRR